MTSTNDGKDVKTNQTGGQKGKSYYIELYKSLDAQLSSECELSERVALLCNAWRRVYTLCQHSAPTTHPFLITWIQRHTARTVLQSEWQSPKGKDEHPKLVEALDSFVQECRFAAASRDVGALPWESQLQARAQWFKGLLDNPWGHPVLKVLLDPKEPSPTTDEILKWLLEERGVVFAARLRQLALAKCDDLALTLLTAVMDRVRQSHPPPDDSAANNEPPQPKPEEPTFESILHREANFSEVWDLLTDMELVLLHKREKSSRLIDLVKLTPLANAQLLVDRLISRLESNPKEKKIWKNAKDVATLVAQVMITRCMVVAECSGVVRRMLYHCSRALVRVLGAARLPKAVLAMAAPAGTARHLHTLAYAVHAHQSTESDELKPFVVELYVRAITFGMNELEKLKLKPEYEAAEARATEQTLSSWFIQLGQLLAGSERMRAECSLTAFSVHPDPKLYELIRNAAHKLQAAPSGRAGAAMDTSPIKDEPNTTENSWAMDSHSQTNFVKTSETLNIKQTQHSANVMSTAILNEGEALGLNAELCQDIIVLLSGPRVKTLSWDMDREVLLQNCRAYMERTGGGTRALTTELKYLNLDPSEYQHLPEEDDNEDDIYYGIEKGYEHLVEFEPQPEEIWEDALDFEDTDTAESSSSDEVTPIRKKKNKFLISNSESDSDPLSLVADHKKDRTERKERPHSKERSSSKERKHNDDSKRDSKRHGHKKDKKERKKEKKERKKKEKKEKQKPAHSLSHLVGVKLTQVSLEDARGLCVTDSDYDSQGKSSLQSEGNDEHVVYDGQFSMDELKSPNKLSPVYNMNLNKELNVASEHIAKALNQTSGNNGKAQINSATSAPVHTESLCTASKSVSHADSKEKISRDELKKSISKLIQYRKQKSSTSLSSLIGTKLQNTTTHNMSFNKTQTEQLALMKNEAKGFRSAIYYPSTQPKHSPDVCSRTQPFHPDRARQKPPTSQPAFDMSNLPQDPTILNNAMNQYSQMQAHKPKSVEQSGEMSHLSCYQQFIKDLGQNRIMPIHKENRKEIKPISKVDPIVPKAKSEPDINTGTRLALPSPPAPKAEPAAGHASSSIQCAKPVPPKKAETAPSNAPNTFARLSYMHKNKLNEKPKPEPNPALQYSVSEELDRRIAELRMSKAVMLTNKKECTLNSGNMPHKQEPPKVEVQAIEQPDKPTLMHLHKDHHVLTNILRNNTETTVKLCTNPEHAQTVSRTFATKPKQTLLTEKDQLEILKLLGQKCRMQTQSTETKIINTNTLNYTNLSKVSHTDVTNKCISVHSNPTPVSKAVPSKKEKQHQVQNNEVINARLPVTLVGTNIQLPMISNTTILKTTKIIQDNKVLSVQQAQHKTKAKEKASQKPKSVLKLQHPAESSNVFAVNQEVSKKYFPKPPQSTPQFNNDTKEQDWAKVMDALRSQKTPNRGPNALEMTMNKDTLVNTNAKNLTAQSPIVKKMEHLISSVLEEQVIQQNKISPNVLRQAPPKSTGNAPHVESFNTSVLGHQTVQQYKTLSDILRPVPTKTTGAVHKVIPKHGKKAEIRKKPTEVETGKPNILNPLVISSEVTRQKIQPQLHKEDPFISGIENSDFDILEELLDDDLRKEISELSSDEDNYGAAVVPAKGPKHVVHKNTSTITIKNNLQSKPKLTVEPRVLDNANKISQVIQMPTASTPKEKLQILSNERVDIRNLASKIMPMIGKSSSVSGNEPKNLTIYDSKSVPQSASTSVARSPDVVHSATPQPSGQNMVIHDPFGVAISNQNFVPVDNSSELVYQPHIPNVGVNFAGQVIIGKTFIVPTMNTQPASINVTFSAPTVAASMPIIQISHGPMEPGPITPCGRSLLINNQSQMSTNPANQQLNQNPPILKEFILKSTKSGNDTQLCKTKGPTLVVKPKVTEKCRRIVKDQKVNKEKLTEQVSSAIIKGTKELMESEKSTEKFNQVITATEKDSFLANKNADEKQMALKRQVTENINPVKTSKEKDAFHANKDFEQLIVLKGQATNNVNPVKASNEKDSFHSNKDADEQRLVLKGQAIDRVYPLKVSNEKDSFQANKDGNEQRIISNEPATEKMITVKASSEKYFIPASKDVSASQIALKRQATDKINPVKASSEKDSFQAKDANEQQTVLNGPVTEKINPVKASIEKDFIQASNDADEKLLALKEQATERVSSVKVLNEKDSFQSKKDADEQVSSVKVINEKDSFQSKKDAEEKRITIKRQAIINRRVHHYLDNPSIELAYSPLTVAQMPKYKKTGNCLITKQSESVKINCEKDLTKNKEENEDTALCRRILLRSSNKITDVDKQCDSDKLGWKNKVRLKDVDPVEIQSHEISEEIPDMESKLISKISSYKLGKSPLNDQIAITKVDPKMEECSSELGSEVTIGKSTKLKQTPRIRISKRLLNKKIKKSNEKEAKVPGQKFIVREKQKKIKNKVIKASQNIAFTKVDAEPDSDGFLDIEAAIAGAKILKAKDFIESTLHINDTLMTSTENMVKEESVSVKEKISRKKNKQPLAEIDPLMEMPKPNIDAIEILSSPEIDFINVNPLTKVVYKPCDNNENIVSTNSENVIPIDVKKTEGVLVSNKTKVEDVIQVHKNELKNAHAHSTLTENPVAVELNKCADSLSNDINIPKVELSSSPEAKPEVSDAVPKAGIILTKNEVLSLISPIGQKISTNDKLIRLVDDIESALNVITETTVSLPIIDTPTDNENTTERKFIQEIAVKSLTKSLSEDATKIDSASIGHKKLEEDAISKMAAPLSNSKDEKHNMINEGAISICSSPKVISVHHTKQANDKDTNSFTEDSYIATMSITVPKKNILENDSFATKIVTPSVCEEAFNNCIKTNENHLQDTTADETVSNDQVEKNVEKEDLETVSLSDDSEGEPTLKPLMGPKELEGDASPKMAAPLLNSKDGKHKTIDEGAISICSSPKAISVQHNEQVCEKDTILFSEDSYMETMSVAVQKKYIYDNNSSFAKTVTASEEIINNCIKTNKNHLQETKVDEIVSNDKFEKDIEKEDLETVSLSDDSEGEPITKLGNDNTFTSTEVNDNTISSNLLTQNDIPQSYKDSIRIVELPIPGNTNPCKRSVRITLPNKRLFRATVVGPMTVSFDSLFEDPALKRILLSDLKDKKTYTLNIPTLRTTVHSAQPKTMETVDLVSDDEDEPVSPLQQFKTATGSYKIKHINYDIFMKHQEKLAQNCIVKLQRCDERSEKESLVEALIKDLVPHLNSDMTPSEVIEIDDSASEDESGLPKIDLLKDKLLKDLGVEDNLQIIDISQNDVPSAVVVENKHSPTCELKYLRKSDPITVIIPEQRSSSQNQDKSRNGDIVIEDQHQPDYSQIIKRQCCIDLVRCDDMIKDLQHDEDNEQDYLSEEHLIACNDFDFTDIPLSRSGSFSLLNDLEILDVPISKKTTNSPKFYPCDNVNRTSPVMEVYDTIAAFKEKLMNNIVRQFDADKCRSDWLRTKRNLHFEQIETENNEEYVFDKSDSLTDCDTDVTDLETSFSDNEFPHSDTVSSLQSIMAKYFENNSIVNVLTPLSTKLNSVLPKTPSKQTNEFACCISASSLQSIMAKYFENNSIVNVLTPLSTNLNSVLPKTPTKQTNEFACCISASSLQSIMVKYFQSNYILNVNSDLPKTPTKRKTTDLSKHKSKVIKTSFQSIDNMTKLDYDHTCLTPEFVETVPSKEEISAVNNEDTSFKLKTTTSYTKHAESFKLSEAVVNEQQRSAQLSPSLIKVISKLKSECEDSNSAKESSRLDKIETFDQSFGPAELQDYKCTINEGEEVLTRVSEIPTECEVRKSTFKQVQSPHLSDEISKTSYPAIEMDVIDYNPTIVETTTCNNKRYSPVESSELVKSLAELVGSDKNSYNLSAINHQSPIDNTDISGGVEFKCNTTRSDIEVSIRSEETLIPNTYKSRNDTPEQIKNNSLTMETFAETGRGEALKTTSNIIKLQNSVIELIDLKKSPNILDHTSHQPLSLIELPEPNILPFINDDTFKSHSHLTKISEDQYTDDLIHHNTGVDNESELSLAEHSILSSTLNDCKEIKLTENSTTTLETSNDTGVTNESEISLAEDSVPSSTQNNREVIKLTETSTTILETSNDTGLTNESEISLAEHSVLSNTHNDSEVRTLTEYSTTTLETTNDTRDTNENEISLTEHSVLSSTHNDSEVRKLTEDSTTTLETSNDTGVTNECKISIDEHTVLSSTQDDSEEMKLPDNSTTTISTSNDLSVSLSFSLEQHAEMATESEQCRAEANNKNVSLYSNLDTDTSAEIAENTLHVLNASKADVNEDCNKLFKNNIIIDDNVQHQIKINSMTEEIRKQSQIEDSIIAEVVHNTNDQTLSPMELPELIIAPLITDDTLHCTSKSPNKLPEIKVSGDKCSDDLLCNNESEISHTNNSFLSSTQNDSEELKPTENSITSLVTSSKMSLNLSLDQHTEMNSIATESSIEADSKNVSADLNIDISVAVEKNALLIFDTPKADVPIESEKLLKKNLIIDGNVQHTLEINSVAKQTLKKCQTDHSIIADVETNDLPLSLIESPELEIPRLIRDDTLQCTSKSPSDLTETKLSEHKCFDDLVSPGTKVNDNQEISRAKPSVLTSTKIRISRDKCSDDLLCKNESEVSHTDPSDLSCTQNDSEELKPTENSITCLETSSKMSLNLSLEQHTEMNNIATESSVEVVNKNVWADLDTDTSVEVEENALLILDTPKADVPIECEKLLKKNLIIEGNVQHTLEINSVAKQTFNSQIDDSTIADVALETNGLPLSLIESPELEIPRLIRDDTLHCTSKSPSHLTETKLSEQKCFDDLVSPETNVTDIQEISRAKLSILTSIQNDGKLTKDSTKTLETSSDLLLSLNVSLKPHTELKNMATEFKQCSTETINKRNSLNAIFNTDTSAEAEDKLESSKCDVSNRGCKELLKNNIVADTVQQTLKINLMAEETRKKCQIDDNLLADVVHQINANENTGQEISRNSQDFVECHKENTTLAKLETEEATNIRISNTEVTEYEDVKSIFFSHGCNIKSKETESVNIDTKQKSTFTKLNAMGNIIPIYKKETKCEIIKSTKFSDDISIKSEETEFVIINLNSPDATTSKDTNRKQSDGTAMVEQFLDDNKPSSIEILDRFHKVVLSNAGEDNLKHKDLLIETENKRETEIEDCKRIGSKDLLIEIENKRETEIKNCMRVASLPLKLDASSEENVENIAKYLKDMIGQDNCTVENFSEYVTNTKQPTSKLKEILEGKLEFDVILPSATTSKSSASASIGSEANKSNENIDWVCHEEVIDNNLSESSELKIPLNNISYAPEIQTAVQDNNNKEKILPDSQSPISPSKKLFRNSSKEVEAEEIECINETEIVNEKKINDNSEVNNDVEILSPESKESDHCDNIIVEKLIKEIDIDESILKKNATLLYKDDSGVTLKGIEYEHPEIGTCYVFPLLKEDTSPETSQLLNKNINSSIEVISTVSSDNEIQRPECIINLHDDKNLEVLQPKITYFKRNLKRKSNMKDVILFKKRPRRNSRIKETYPSRNRIDKKIDAPKLTAAAIKDLSYNIEFQDLMDYYDTVDFSYSITYSREFIDVSELLQEWPIQGATINYLDYELETEYALYDDTKDTEKTKDPLELTVAEELTANYNDANYSNDGKVEETNANVGFGERSGRVIQNLDGGAISKFSAATLSDVKQSQPFLLSEKCDDINKVKFHQSSQQEQVETLKRFCNYLKLKEKVRSFFRNTTIELTHVPHKKKDSINNEVASKFPFHLYIPKTIEPRPIEAVVHVVQVGQLPVSAAVQNPVTCDPRVTQVSDASPSQCSVDNSPHDSQQDTRTEYTELTTADLSMPLVEDYVQHNQSLSTNSQEGSNITISTENIPIQTELLKSGMKFELADENPDEKEKNTENCDQTDATNHVNNVEDYIYDSNNTNAAVEAEIQALFESEKQDVSATTPDPKPQNGSVEKTDQIAHAMNAAGITTTTESVTNRAQAFVNLISQKIRQSAVVSTSNSSNNYPKTTTINAMSLQQALAQILPPPLNHTNSSENNQQTQNTVTPQVLHIVQGKSSSGNQITLVENTQQSVINTPNATPVLHIVQNKPASGATSNGSPAPQPNTFSGISLVDAGLQQGGNQLLHIVNTGNQKNNNTSQLLKRVNLLTNLANVQASNEQKMVQFVCKSADGKSIQLNAPHQRSMVLRLQPIDPPNIQPATPKTVDNHELLSNAETPIVTVSTIHTPNKTDTTNSQEIKSRSVYEENYAKFIQSSSNKSTVLEKLPKFNQAFGKSMYQDGTQKQNEINTNNLPSVNTGSENSECPPTDNAINLDHIGPISSPPLLLRKSPQTTQPQPNIVQQIKQAIAPMNLQTMHGGVIYTRQIPVNIGSGQTINLITVPNTEIVDESTQKQQISQESIEPSIIKIVPQGQPQITNTEGTSASEENAQQNPPQSQPVLTQMRIKLPMLSKNPQMVSGARVVRPSFFQIQRNIVGGANQPVYQQLVLTAAPPLGQQTIRLPQTQTRQIKIPENQSSETQMSSSTLEQLREFDMVLEQVKERSTGQPNSNSSSSFKIHNPSTDTTSPPSTTSTSAAETTQVLYSIGSNQPLNVTYINRKTNVNTPTTSTFVRSPDSTGIADSPTSSSSQVQSQTEAAESSSSGTTTQPKVKISSRQRPRPKPHQQNTVKVTPPPKPSTQKPAEDEQTTQRILYILAEYKEQVENSPDKDKPAPRRRNNPPTNPSGSSKRKKSSSGSRRSGRELSPIQGDDLSRTMGSEDSSCGTSQGDCNESCMDSHSPQDSPRKVSRKLSFEPEPSSTPPPKSQPQRNVIVPDGQTITVARGTAGKPATAVLMPANYILPVSMVKGGQQIAIVTNRGPKLLTVGGGEGGATNALLLQRLIGPAGLKPVLARPGVRHVRLPTATLHNLQAFNLATASTAQPPDSTATPASDQNTPDLVETNRNETSPWADRSGNKPDRASSPDEAEPWNIPYSADPNDYSYEETVRTENMNRTVLVVHKKEPTRQGRFAHVSAAALRHKYAILEHELRLQKSLSEECEDLGVDSPSASELFPEAELLFAGSPAPAPPHDHASDVPQHAHTPQPTIVNQSAVQPDIDDQIATDHLLQRDNASDQQDLDVNLGLEDVGIVTVSEDGMQATIALDHEEFVRSHPNTTFHSEPTDEGEVQPFTISGLRTRHITSTIFHSTRAPATVLMTAPQATVISQATAVSDHAQHNVKYADIDNMMNSIPSTHTNNVNLPSVLVKDDGLTKYDSILTDSRELHLSNTASAIVHSGGNATQVIRRVYDDSKRTRDSYLMDEPDAIIAGDDAKMVAEDSSRDATLESMGGDADDDNSSPRRHAELFWESNSASERSESRRPLDFSSDSDKCCKSPSYDETNSTDSSGIGAHMRLDSVIKDARGIDRSGSADGSSADDTHPPLRTYPPKRLFHNVEGDLERSLSGKTRAGERFPDIEVRRRASGRGVVKRGCHCCNGSPAPPRPKKPRQRKPTMDFTN